MLKKSRSYKQQNNYKLKTLIIGASGIIGKYLSENRNKNYVYTYNRKKISHGIHFDISKNNLNQLCKNFLINKIVLLAAISNPSTCYKNKNFSNFINVTKTKELIDYIINKDIYFIFMSSEYIFCGKKGNYSEKNLPKPNNLYGKQKYLIEEYIKKKTKNFAILRIAKVYSDKLDDKTMISNFFSRLKRGEREFKIAYDQIFNPLYMKDLIKIIKLFLKKEIKGVFNVGGPEQLSRYKCIEKIIEQFDSKNKNEILLKKSKLKNFQFLDKRPLNITMNIAKIKKIVEFKLTKIEDVAKRIIIKNNLNEKLFTLSKNGPQLS